MSECKRYFLRVNVETLGQMKNSSVDLAGKLILTNLCGLFFFLCTFLYYENTIIK